MTTLFERLRQASARDPFERIVGADLLKPIEEITRGHGPQGLACPQGWAFDDQGHLVKEASP